MKRVHSTAPVAIVTGGGRRLGRRIALALAAAGYDIVVDFLRSVDGARRTADDIRRMGRNAIPVKADISRKRDVDRLVATSMKAFGRIDLLVNNSGLFVDGSLLNTSVNMWDAVMDVNLKGMFLCSQAVAPVMLKQRGGHIINIVSLGGIQAWSKHLAYSVSKAGAIMLTKCMAKSLAPAVRVNAIAPGTIIVNGEEDPAIRHVARKTIPLRRYGKPSDIADVVLFLAQHSSYLTGQLIVIDGGRSIQ